MVYHILNGDALIDRFVASQFNGDSIIIVRECLIEGNLSGNTLAEFWQNRAEYIANVYHENQENYFKRVVSEYQKVIAAPDHSEFNLWFGYDLFCQANMWFVLSILIDLPINKKIFVVYPSYLKPNDKWKDFGGAEPSDLKECFQNRIPFGDSDLLLAKNLWDSYKNSKLARLQELSRQHSDCFPYLKEVCEAHIERFPENNQKGRPERVIENIIQENTKDFYSVFEEFFKREGVYGFGDSQVKQIYDKVIGQH